MEKPDQSILEKTLDNEATAEETRMALRWFKTPEGQAWLLERMDQDESSILPGEEEAWIDHPLPSAEIYELIMRQLRRQRMRRIMAYAAAILMPLILFSWLFVRLNSQVNLFTDNQYEVVEVPFGEKIQVLFQDGSKVHLNSGSRIRYPKKFRLSERKVFLEGEAWFDVAPDTHSPFIVDLSCMQVQVVGTQFDIKAYPEDKLISVSLESGIIQLESGTFRQFRMKPGEKAVYDRESEHCRVFATDDAPKYSAWRRHTLVFEETTLADVIKELSRTYNKKFIVKDPSCLKYTYTLTSNGVQFSSVLREMEKITPVQFLEKEDVIEIVHQK